VPSWLVVLLLCLATHRVTRLVTRDAFPPARAVRTWVQDRTHEEHWLAYLSQCDWCASVWVGGALTGGLAAWVALAARQSWWPWPLWLGVWLTTSTVTGLIAQREPD
jgi:hypothetical protein